jgi:hypothetical protein
MQRSTLTRGYNVSIVMGMEITNEIYDVRRRDAIREGMAIAREHMARCAEQQAEWQLVDEEAS